MDEQIIWEAGLDSKFQCKVVRTTDGKGTLTVVEEATGRVLLNTRVPLSYGAMFGPDVDDVAYWREMCIEAVDSQ